MIDKNALKNRLASRIKARTNLLDFTRFTMPEYRVNWHHELICKKLDEFIDGQNKRLIIACPPRHGKSELVSRRLPAYLLGKNPDCKIIACSYSSDLSSLMNRDVQRIIDSPEYSELFPNTSLSASNVRTTAQENHLRNSDIFEIVGHKGVYRSAGVGGSITGMGGNCLTGDTLIFTNFGAVRLDFLVNSYKYNKWYNNWYRVLSYDHDNEKPVWRRIETARHLRSSRILEITTSSGYKIRVTPEHRIFIKDKGYTEACSLQQGDRIYYCDEPKKQRMPVLRNDSKGTRGTLYELLSEPSESFSGSQMLPMRRGIREEAIRLPQMFEERLQGCLLFKNVLKCSSRGKECKELRYMRNTNAREESKQILFSRMQEGSFKSEDRSRKLFSEWFRIPLSKADSVSRMWNRVQTAFSSNYLLLKRLCRQSTFKKNDRQRELKLQTRNGIFQNVPRNETFDIGEGQLYMLRMWNKEYKTSSSSHKREKERQFSRKSYFDMQNMSWCTPQVSTDTISSIKDVSSGEIEVYDLQIKGTNNFFANQILVHNCLIIDDPFRSRADAESPTIRNKVYEWYTSTFRTRRQKGASILLTATRWHEDDLTGRLLELAKNDPSADQWEVITLPALSEEEIAPYDKRTEPNRALWVDEYPEKDLLSTKASSTVYEWLSLYQQRPSAAAGNLVKKENFKYCTLQNNILDLGDKKYLLNQCKIFQTCDPAASTKTSADYFVLATWAQTPLNELALVDLIRTRLETPDQVPLFKQQHIRWHPVFQAVEKTGLGISLYQTLLREGLPVQKVEADSDKVTRFIPAATRISAGVVYFLAGAPWLNDYETELLGFPNAAHDDMVDCTSTACAIVINQPFISQVYETSFVGASSSGGMRI